MTFYILRHGDKEDGQLRNPDLPLNDQPISELGQAQARSVRAWAAGFWMLSDLA